MEYPIALAWPYAAFGFFIGVLVGWLLRYFAHRRAAAAWERRVAELEAQREELAAAKTDITERPAPEGGARATADEPQPVSREAPAADKPPTPGAGGPADDAPPAGPPAEAIDGIGPRLARKLRDMDIVTVADLRERGADAAGRRRIGLALGLDEATVQEWVSRAEALAASGSRSPQSSAPGD